MDSATKDDIRRLVSGRVLFDEPMRRHTSIGVGGSADALIYPQDVGELREVTILLSDRGADFLPVGNCTNIIVRDGGYRGVLICLEKLNHVELHDTGDPQVILTAGAGALLSQVIERSAKEGLSGMEFLSGIPGSVGGGVAMNAGARGREIKDVVWSVAGIDRGGEARIIRKEDLRFEYRRFCSGENVIVTGASFSLSRDAPEAIRQRIAGALSIRKLEQPLEYRSAGCIFKNPPGGFAGKMIEEAGMKGIQVGDARVSDKHANYIVNMGAARAQDIIALIRLIQQKVKARGGIMLEPEVHIIGENGE